MFLAASVTILFLVVLAGLTVIRLSKGSSPNADCLAELINAMDGRGPAPVREPADGAAGHRNGHSRPI